MDTVETICGLLEQKRQKFLAYEQATLELIESDADSAENYITERSVLATDIDELSEQIGRLCDAETRVSPQLMLDIVNARCDYERVPPEYRPVYDAAQDVRSVAARIRQADEQALRRLEAWRDEAKDKIRENQNLPKIKKYLTDLSDGQNKPTLRNEKA